MPSAYRAAIAAKGARGVALVSDAMPPAAGGPDVFELQGRRMTRVGRKLVAENGTLAGAAITMRDAIDYVVKALGLPLAHALTMATLTPARLLGLDERIGRLAPGHRADLVHLTDALAGGGGLGVRASAQGGRSDRLRGPRQRTRSFIAIRAASAPDFIAPVKPPNSAKDEAR